MPTNKDSMFSFRRYLKEMPEDEKNDAPIHFEGVKAGDLEGLLDAIDQVQAKRPDLAEAAKDLQEAADKYRKVKKSVQK